MATKKSNSNDDNIVFLLTNIEKDTRLLSTLAVIYMVLQVLGGIFLFILIGGIN